MTSLQFFLDRSYFICTDEVLTTARVFAAWGWGRAAILILVLSQILVIHLTDLSACNRIWSNVLLNFPTALKNFFLVHIMIRNRWITNALHGDGSRLCSSSSYRSQLLFAFWVDDHFVSFVFFYLRGTKRRPLQDIFVPTTPWSKRAWSNGKYSSPTLSFANLLTLPQIGFMPFLIILTIEFASNNKK